MVYNSYTSKDVKHLVEYLAENNRDGKGRCGNMIYKQLVENQKKWPWSKNHPWQSWRDHFVKNEAKINKKIKIYQREHGISAEAHDSENEDNKAMEIDIADTGRCLAWEEERSGSPVEKESVCSRKRVRETERGPSASDRKRQKVMKEGCEVRRFSLPKKGSNTSLVVGHMLAENEVKAEPTHSDKEDTGDRQEVNQTLAPDKQIDSTGTSGKVLARRAVPSTSHRFSALARKVPAPTLSDDSFDSLFDADSDILVPDSDEAPLPGRVQYRDQQRDDFFQSSSDASRSDDKRRSLPRKRHPPTLVEGPFKTTLTSKASPPGRIRQDADLKSDVAEVTSPWPPIRTKPRTPRSLKDQKRQARKRGQVKYDDSDVQAVVHHATGVDVDHWHENNCSHTASDTGPIYTPQRQLSKNVKLERSPTVENGEHSISLFPKPRTTGSAESQIPMEEGICDDSGFGNDQDSTGTQSHRVDHPEQGASGDSRAISQASQNGRYVDLHEEEKRRYISRRPSDILGSSRGTTASSVLSISHGRQSPISIQLSTQDQSLVTTLGIQQAVTMMSKNHGFTEDVVSRILQNVSSIPRADEILREMRVKAEEAALNHLMLSVPRVRRSSKQKTDKPSRASQKFEIQAISEDEMSDYSPPSKTRAGQFSRLVEQGRHEEAYAREARRASGVGHASNNSNVENDTRSPSKARSRAEPKAVEDGVFFNKRVEEIGAEAAVKDIADLRDAHVGMAPAFEQHESNLSPQRALQRFQQTARIVKQILIDC